MSFAISGPRSQSQGDQREYKFPRRGVGVLRSHGTGLRDDRASRLLEAILRGSENRIT